MQDFDVGDKVRVLDDGCEAVVSEVTFYLGGSDHHKVYQYHLRQRVEQTVPLLLKKNAWYYADELEAIDGADT